MPEGSKPDIEALAAAAGVGFTAEEVDEMLRRLRISRIDALCVTGTTTKGWLRLKNTIGAVDNVGESNRG